MPVKKSPSDFIDELKAKAPNILPLDAYKNNRTKIRCECRKCGNQWLVTPAHLLSGKGCPICARKKSAAKRKYSKEKFSEKIHLIHPNIEVVGDYINSQTKIEVHCVKCNNRWNVVPASLLSGTGCPKCNKRFRRTTDSFIKELSAVSPNISVLGQYKNAHEKLQVKCNRCGTEWYAEPNGLLKGNDCPFCGHSQTSVIEQILYRSFCVLVGKEKVKNRDKTIIGKELDVYIQKLALALEFGAWYWHSDRIQNDYEKERLCDLLGIRLITIYEGCPKGLVADKLKNAIYYTNTISNEKDFRTIKTLILSLCKNYDLNPSEVIKQWESIVKQAKEESRKKDAEEFVKELSVTNPNIEYIGGYAGSKNRVYVKCRICGTKWFASSAYDVLNGHGCPECAKIQRGVSQRMSKEEFHARVLEINPNIELLGEYNGPKAFVLCRCKKCGNEWKAKPDSILYKRRNCPMCSPVTKKTNEQFIEELSAISNSIVPLEEYKNTETKIRFICKKCSYEWIASPKDVLRGTGCPKCAHRIGISHEEFILRVKQKNKNVEIIGEYKDTKTKIQCRCKICGYEWSGIPSNLLKGAGCQRCAGTIRLSNEEFQIRLSASNPTITPLEPYKNRNTKILCRCESCGNEWRGSPGNLLNGHGCPNCKANNIRKSRERKVMCIETGMIYDSVLAAKTTTGITTISDCLHHRTKTAGRFHWAYVDKSEDE